MKRFLFPALITLGLMGASFGHAAVASPYATCVLEARTAITSTASYRNGSLRDKQRLLNASSPEVSRKIAQCAKVSKSA